MDASILDAADASLSSFSSTSASSSSSSENSPRAKAEAFISSEDPFVDVVVFDCFVAQFILPASGEAVAFFIIEGHADSIFKVFSAVSIAARVFSIALHKAKGALLPLFAIVIADEVHERNLEMTVLIGKCVQGFDLRTINGRQRDGTLIEYNKRWGCYYEIENTPDIATPAMPKVIQMTATLTPDAKEKAAETTGVVTLAPDEEGLTYPRCLQKCYLSEHMVTNGKGATVKIDDMTLTHRLIAEALDRRNAMAIDKYTRENVLAPWNIEEMRSRPGFHEELGRLKKEGQGFLIFAPGNTEIASLSDLFE